MNRRIKFSLIMVVAFAAGGLIGQPVLAATVWGALSSPALTNFVIAVASVAVAGYAVVQIKQNQLIHEREVGAQLDQRINDEHAAAWIVAGEVARIQEVSHIWGKANLVMETEAGRFHAEDCLINDWYTFAKEVRLLGPASSILAIQAVRASTSLNADAVLYMSMVRAWRAAGGAPAGPLAAKEREIKENVAELALLMEDIAHQAVRSDEKQHIDFVKRLGARRGIAIIAVPRPQCWC